ncbi:hypothetical protein COR50_01720 [Chitinophaga caeni]|uniref:Glycosyltransferase 2-like domain-containing protein n=1 Tax=Chitinophaga caeni TaxID=2029983 RepID=A0A291QQ33_9BACT|nr:glycosyltransferase family 2 protein [Chitinophaga caeni]ATL45982.1 hypothetical protein COR50_01720 [Chitinophaga caeni]
MTISVIIPTFNNASNIKDLIHDLFASRHPAICDLIVVDGGSTDQTVTLACESGARALRSPIKGRSAQMNYGAALAQGDIFLFLHPEVRIYKGYVDDILQLMLHADLGCFRFKYQTGKIIPKIGAWLGRISAIFSNSVRQSLFIRRNVFEQLGGFNNDNPILEDYEFIQRGRAYFRFKVIKRPIIASSKKFDEHSYIKVQFVNLIVLLMYKTGFPQQKIIQFYKRRLHR